MRRSVFCLIKSVSWFSADKYEDDFESDEEDNERKVDDDAGVWCKRPVLELVLGYGTISLSSSLGQPPVSSHDSLGLSCTQNKTIGLSPTPHGQDDPPDLLYL